MKVICDKKRGKCPAKCPHSIPHDAFFDTYPNPDDTGYIDIRCDKMKTYCGWIAEQPLCICEEVEDGQERI